MDPGALWHWGRSAEQLAILAGVHLTTARRWKSGRSPRPSILKLVRLVLSGELEEISRAWRGWRITGEELVSPEGWRFTPGMVRAIPLLEAKIARLEADRRLEVQADWVAGAWVSPRR